MATFTLATDPLAAGAVPETAVIRLANRSDAHAIAVLSRDTIEHGLGWRYTPDRVLAAIRSRSTNVVVVHERGCLLAGGIMDYGDNTAHLVLLGVQRTHRRRGLGRQVLTWLQACAITAGLESVRVEVREDNPNALAFYQTHGYRVRDRVTGYYGGVLDAVRLAKSLGVQSLQSS
ncbi:MAG: GNAT family N-acetyltransferase [Luteimonas sp.]